MCKFFPLQHPPPKVDLLSQKLRVGRAQRNHLVLFQGASRELWYHHCLCLSTEKNSVRDKMVDKKWFIRIGHL